MANNNVQNVKFLRNGSVFTPSIDPVKTAREVALSAMNGQLNSLADGTAILGRYQETNGIVKTLVGFAYISGETKTLTVFDVDGAGADVDAKILAAIQALDAEKTSTDGINVQVKVTEVDGKVTAVNITTDNTVNSGDVASAIATEIGKLDKSDTAVAGQYVSQVSQADGKIAVTRVALPTVAAISETGKPITAVSESLGEISATAGTIDAQYVNINDAGGIITATNVEGALAEIAAEIDAMDKDADVVAGQVVTTVSEADGVVSETKANVKDLQLGGYAKDTTATGDVASTDTINAALSKLENKAAAITITNADGSINVTTGASGTDINVNIKSNEHVLAKDGNAGLYTDIKLSAVTPSSTTVKEEYSLVGTDGTVLGTNIKIYKDSSIVSITYITDPADAHYQNLEYVYIDASGDTQTEYVDMSTLVIEAEFESGVTANAAGVVHGVVDSSSEKDSQNAAFLTVGADGFKVSGIKDEIDRKIEALDVTSDTAVAGQYVAAIEQTDGLVAVKTRANVSEALLNNYSKGSTSGAVASTDTVNQAISKLEVRLDGELAALDADVSGNSTHVTVGVKEENGKVTAVTVSESNIANADDLSSEIAARKAVDGQNGQTYVANSGKKFISGATSLNDADVALNDALENVDSKYVSGVTVNGKAVTVSSHVAPISISATNGTGASATPIVINTDNNTGAVTIQLEGLDCGTY